MSYSRQRTASLVEGSGKNNPNLGGGGGRSPSQDSGKVITVTANLGQSPNRFPLFSANFGQFCAKRMVGYALLSGLI